MTALRLDDLPSRRVEGWRWSDLRAALGDQPLPANDLQADVLAALAGGVELIVVGPGEARLLLVDATELGHAQEIRLEPGAEVTRIVTQPGADGVITATARVQVAEGARFRQFILAEGAKLSRLETHVEVTGPGAAVELYGVYLVGAGRHADLTSSVTHTAAGASTAQLIKGAARRGGRGVFQGRIQVAPHAQQTDARQHHQALLLEEGAEVFAKPELMIYADDVSCAHGNAIGGLPADQLFYLRARGLQMHEARALLTEAFLAESAPDWLPEDAHARALNRIGAWLGGAR